MTILAGWSVTKPILVLDLSSRFEDSVSSGRVTVIISSTQFLVPSTRPGPVEPERTTGRRNRWYASSWSLATRCPMLFSTCLTIKMRDKRILSTPGLLFQTLAIRKIPLLSVSPNPFAPLPRPYSLFPRLSFPSAFPLRSVVRPLSTWY